MPLATCPNGNLSMKRRADDFDFNRVLKLTEELKKKQERGFKRGVKRKSTW
jgi:hypothetical protein